MRPVKVGENLCHYPQERSDGWRAAESSGSKLWLDGGQERREKLDGGLEKNTG